MTLEEQIIREANRLGFGAVGIATAGPSASYQSYLDWLSGGNAGEMGYLTKHAAIRVHPNRLAPGVKSVIAAGAGYPVNAAPGAGFSSYARGEDYHDLLRAKLRRLAEFIGEREELSVARVCVDSAPLLEREWAIRAGIGWQGRQGQLVSPALGCCFVLGFLLVDLELSPSPVVADRCGNCTECLQACPTGAIDTERRVDARKCISYLTTEHDGDIPDRIASRMGQSLFGCDFCTAICPWNARKNRMVMGEFTEGISLPTTEECAEMSESDFRLRFVGSSVFRAGLARLKRSARIALANAATSRAVPHALDGTPCTPGHMPS